MLLFLDFDGVLHPTRGGRPIFCALPRLAAWLTRWPQVDVVISSSWRDVHTQHELVSMLGPVGARVVGCTPLPTKAQRERYTPSGQRPKHAERQAEVLAWIEMSWDPQRKWVALDDMADWFDPGCPHLVACDGAEGLTWETMVRLDVHARRAGLKRTRAASSGASARDGSDLGRRVRFPNHTKLMLKHLGSGLPDAFFEVEVDRIGRVVTVTSRGLDTWQLGRLVTQILPDKLGVQAYREDDGWLVPAAHYELRVRLRGPTDSDMALDMTAEVVLLSKGVGGGVAVRLSEPRPRGRRTAIEGG